MVGTNVDINYKALYEQSQLTIASLQQELAHLKKMIFGSKHERFIPSENNPTQLTLAIEAETVAACNIIDAKKIEYTRITKEVIEKKEHPGRMKLPEHLERREKIIEPTEDVSDCKKIGEEITEELEYEPGKLFVNRYVRPKYAKPNNAGILTASMIERPLPKAIAGAGLLAQIVIDKYVDHLPLYDALKLLIVQSDYLHADESPIKVLDKDKKGETHRGYFWVYHNSIAGLVLFDYQAGRGREGPQEMLKDFKGHLQTDGYTVYDFFKESEDVTVLHCMAHARRKFYEALANDKLRAEYALEQFGLLYAIERKAKEAAFTHEQRLALRRHKAIPILQQMGKWMEEQYVMVLPKSSIGKALGYSIERWNELMIYAGDGKLNIDNNPVENSIRPIAIGRKNYLFAGSHEAAQRSAMLYSLLGTCKLHGINPFLWLRDVLNRIATHHINKIEELLPHNWKPAYTSM